MNSKIIALCTLFALLLGSVVCDEGDSDTTIKIQVFGASSIWWIAVDPQGEIYDTVAVEIREAASPNWVLTSPNLDWGYFQLASTSGRGFALPLSFRFTASNGQRVVASSILTGISAGYLVDTGVQYPSVTADTPTDAPTQAPAPTQAATQAPATHAPTQAPTPTQAATQAPATPAPTQPPTHAPTLAPTQPGTHAPTQTPPQAPTEKPTQAPTQPATQAPTQPATQAPTQAPSTDVCALVPTTTEPMKILVPLYIYPGSAWDELVTAAATGVKIIAIINPNSGPDSTGPDSSYVTYMQKLADAGVEMIGYVHTSWGTRAIATIESEIDTYASLYSGLSGIFFDEGATASSELPYYTTAYNYVLSKSGYTQVIINPGLQPDQGYLAVSTSLVIYEDYASNLAATTFSSWVQCAPNAASKAGYKYKFSAITHTATLADMPTLIAEVSNMGIGLVYVTDGLGGCCTYNALTSFFPQEASSVQTLNS